MEEYPLVRTPSLNLDPPKSQDKTPRQPFSSSSHHTRCHFEGIRIFLSSLPIDGPSSLSIASFFPFSLCVCSSSSSQLICSPPRHSSFRGSPWSLRLRIPPPSSRDWFNDQTLGSSLSTITIPTTLYSRKHLLVVLVETETRHLLNPRWQWTEREILSILWPPASYLRFDYLVKR